MNAIYFRELEMQLSTVKCFPRSPGNTDFLDLAVTLFKCLKVMLFTSGEINHVRQKISVVNTSLNVEGSLGLLFRFTAYRFFRSQSEIELLLCSNRIFSLKMLIKTALD